MWGSETYLIQGRYSVMVKGKRALLGDIMCNARMKHYPDGSRRLYAFSADILREPGWEQEGRRGKSGRAQGEAAAAAADDNLLRSKRRARAAVQDIALSNEFRFFVTLTLDKSKVNRYDVSEVTRKLNNWLDNNVRRKGLAYILVPELHKDGAIHFHGFFNDALPVVDSGTLDTGAAKPRKPRSEAQRARLLADGAHIVYNLPNWSMGFSTAIELYGDYRAAVNYVCKYITKAADKVGGRWYYSGGALARPEVTYHRADFAQLCDRYAERCSVYEVEALGCRGLVIELEANENGNELVGLLSRLRD